MQRGQKPQCPATVGEPECAEAEFSDVGVCGECCPPGLIISNSHYVEILISEEQVGVEDALWRRGLSHLRRSHAHLLDGVGSLQSRSSPKLTRHASF